MTTDHGRMTSDERIALTFAVRRHAAERWDLIHPIVPFEIREWQLSTRSGRLYRHQYIK